MNKLDKQEATHLTIAPSTSQVGKPSDPPRKVKFPCKLCKGDHIIRDCPGVPRILEVWPHDLAHPSFPFDAHVDPSPSTGRLDSPVGYVKATISFTSVHSWIKLPPF